MARPREFDPDAAIQDAVNVFWKLGYTDASLPDLLAGMKLTRGSLYKAFKDKKNLFLLALEKYDHEEVQKAVDILEDDRVADGWDRIIAVYRVILGNLQSGDRRGCLLCSAAAGPAHFDPEIAETVQAGMMRMRAGFVSALKATQSDPGLADMLLSQYVGMRIQSRSATPIEQMQASLKAIEALRKT